MIALDAVLVRTVCPQSAIKVTDVAVISEKDCVDCGACVDECPNGAITVDE